jgi:hypothetical protein
LIQLPIGISVTGISMYIIAKYYYYYYTIGSNFIQFTDGNKKYIHINTNKV